MPTGLLCQWVYCANLYCAKMKSNCLHSDSEGSAVVHRFERVVVVVVVVREKFGAIISHGFEANGEGRNAVTCVFQQRSIQFCLLFRVL